MKELELKMQGKIDRLTKETFKFDPRVKEGWYSAVYFNKTKQIVEKYRPDNHVTMQFFTRKEAILCGVDEAIALLEDCCPNFDQLEISALHDGDKISAFEPVLKIKGPYQEFGYIEGVIDGILARRSSVATNVYLATKEAKDTPIIFMGDRDDHFSNQAGDGYAAYIGGVTAQATCAMNEWWGDAGVGTMPHALIQIFEGDVIKAAHAYIETFPKDNLVVLIDYNNDVITDSLLVANEFKEKLYAVRVDTSGNLMDKYFETIDWQSKNIDPFGVNPTLIKALRKALDDNGHHYVKIIVSGGFNAQKIKLFKEQNVPVDSFGVGRNLLSSSVSFTGDCVQLNGVNNAKVGRKNIENPRLQLVKRKVD